MTLHDHRSGATCVGVTFYTLLVLAFGFPAPAAKGQADQGEFSGHGFNVIRIENEIKLTVPDDLLEPVWKYLTVRYHHDDPFLSQWDMGFSTVFSEEHFVDRYFDDDRLQLLKRESGIRHRTRRIDDNPDHPKHNRQLVQVKLSRENDQIVNRSEIKFPVKPYYRSLEAYAEHPLIGLIDPAYRTQFIQLIEGHGITPVQLAPVVTLDQKRRRVYISRNGEPFATLTLDEVSSEKWGAKVAFVELEMELNEIGYTEASPKERQFMERINEEMKQDLLAAFPRIVQDQTPKYNKVFQEFNRQFLFFPQAVKWGAPFKNIFSSLAILAVMAGSVLMLDRRQKGAKTIQTC